MAKTKQICRINVDSYRCNGCESCVALCPELFRINEASGKAEAINDTAPCSTELEQAASSCPVECIEIEQK
ncbi:MAG: ferredoxin [Desulfobulbaceae bacterium]|nr:ferredoxin [Desulfobulbaceae bacterium]